MAESLTSWGRPLFQPSGGNAFLMYLVYGGFDLPPTISRSRYRTEGLPQNIDILAHDRLKHPEAFRSMLEPPLGDQMASQDPTLLDNSLAASQCIRIQGEVPDPGSLDYLRDTIGVVTYFAEQGGVTVFDQQTLRGYSPDRWLAEIAGPADTRLSNHVVILYSTEDDARAEWLHTRGLRKFGRPDISVHGVTQDYRTTVIEMINRFIVMQIQGACIAEGETIRMDGLPEGLTCRHRGHLDDHDFNNVHVEIVGFASRAE